MISKRFFPFHWKFVSVCDETNEDGWCICTHIYLHWMRSKSEFAVLPSTIDASRSARCMKYGISYIIDVYIFVPHRQPRALHRNAFLLPFSCHWTLYTMQFMLPAWTSFHTIRHTWCWDHNKTIQRMNIYYSYILLFIVMVTKLSYYNCVCLRIVRIRLMWQWSFVV